MFENIRARIKKLEEDHESIHKAKLHVEKYQLVYAAAGSSVLTLVAVRTFGGPQVIIKEAANLPAVINNTINNTPVFNNENIGNQLINAGPCCKIVQRLEDEELWGKIKDVVEELSQEHNVPTEAVRRMMSRHFRGELEDVFGKHYERIATRTAY